MNYELAKELKEAGCPGVFEQGDNGGIHLPTLSELIEACGHRFGTLGRWRGDKPWRAFSVHIKSGAQGRYAYGSTPEEAVARLWLALRSERVVKHSRREEHPNGEECSDCLD